MNTFTKQGGTGGFEGNLDRNNPDARQRFTQSQVQVPQLSQIPQHFRDLGLSNIEKDSVSPRDLLFAPNSTISRISRLERRENKVQMSARMQQKYGRNDDLEPEVPASLLRSTFQEVAPNSSRCNREAIFEVDQSQIVEQQVQESTSQQLLKFQKNLLAVLSKFSKQHTLKQGIDEIKQLMAQDITDNDRMSMFLSSITDFKIHDQAFQIKEQIKIFGIASEIFEDSLAPFLPKILVALTKQIKDDQDGKYVSAISDTVGQIVQNLIESMDEGEQLSLFETQFIKFVFNLIEKSQNKVIISTALQCLTKIVINCPFHVLLSSLGLITDKMVALLKSKLFPCKQQLLESLISIIFHIQSEFSCFYHKFINLLIEQIKGNNDGKSIGTKRVAIDAIYSIGAHCQDKIGEHREQIIKILDECRTNKNKPVRDAAQETLKLLKEIQQKKNLHDESSDLVNKPILQAIGSGRKRDTEYPSFIEDQVKNSHKHLDCESDHGNLSLIEDEHSNELSPGQNFKEEKNNDGGYLQNNEPSSERGLQTSSARRKNNNGPLDSIDRDRKLRNKVRVESDKKHKLQANERDTILKKNQKIESQYQKNFDQVDDKLNKIQNETINSSRGVPVKNKYKGLFQKVEIPSKNEELDDEPELVQQVPVKQVIANRMTGKQAIRNLIKNVDVSPAPLGRFKSPIISTRVKKPWLKVKNEGFFKNQPSDDVVFAKQPKDVNFVSPSMNEFLNNEDEADDIQIKVPKKPKIFNEKIKNSQEKQIEIEPVKLQAIKSPRSEIRSPMSRLPKPSILGMSKIQEAISSVENQLDLNKDPQIQIFEPHTQAQTQRQIVRGRKPWQQEPINVTATSDPQLQDEQMSPITPKSPMIRLNSNSQQRKPPTPNYVKKSQEIVKAVKSPSIRSPTNSLNKNTFQIASEIKKQDEKQTGANDLKMVLESINKIQQTQNQMMEQMGQFQNMLSNLDHKVNMIEANQLQPQKPRKKNLFNQSISPIQHRFGSPQIPRNSTLVKQLKQEIVQNAVGLKNLNILAAASLLNQESQQNQIIQQLLLPQNQIDSQNASSFAQGNNIIQKKIQQIDKMSDQNIVSQIQSIGDSDLQNIEQANVETEDDITQLSELKM